MNYKLLFLFLFTLNFLYAQHNITHSFVDKPVHPVTSKFPQYINNANIDYASGMISHKVDLFDVNVSGLSLPFNLIYSSSGIKITDSPLPYGYGWSLNINPKVTRRLLGRPDEQYPFKNIITPIYGDWPSRIPFPTYNGDYGPYYESLKGIAERNYINSYFLNENDLFDTQKDIFTIQLLNRSIRFILDWSNGIPIAKAFGNEVKIDVIIKDKNITGLKVIDENGLIYSFGNNINQTGTDFIEVAQSTHVINQVWLLRSIELNNHQIISFSWENKNVSNFSPSTSMPISVSDHKSQSDWNEDPFPTVGDYGGQITMAQFLFNTTKFISHIDLPLGSIHFTYLDYYKPFLTKIVYKNNLDNILTDVSFNYGAVNTNLDNYLLNNIVVNGAKYSFNYNNNRFTNGSSSIDYWGYYNGKSNQTQIPLVNLKQYTMFYGMLDFPNQAIGLVIGAANKSVDQEKMQAFMLNRVILPTGGKVNYEYEPHSFYNTDSYEGFFTTPEIFTTGGGLRVKRITFQDAFDNTLSERQFKYGTNENGIANICLLPTLNSFIDERHSFNYYTGGTSFSRSLSLKSLSDYDSFNFGASSFWYNQVTEYSKGGKTIRSYIYKPDTVSPLFSAKIFHKNYTSNVYTLFQNGPVLSNEKYFKANNGIFTLIKEDEYLYTFKEFSIYQIKNLLIDRFIVTNALGTDPTYPQGDSYPRSAYPLNGVPFTDPFNFNVTEYNIIPGFYRLDKHLDITYQGDNTTVKETQYSYDTNKITYVSSKEIKGSDNTLSKLTYKYPWNFNDPINQLLVTNNRIQSPVEEIFEKNNEKVITKKGFKNDFSFNIITNNSYKKTINNSVIFLDSVIKNDRYGNPLEVKSQNLPSTVYLWGYDGQYPIAKIENATYDEVKDILTEAVINSLNSATVTDATILNTIATLRNNSAMQKAQVWTYTYKPLVGMSSEIDPRGIKTEYTYDSFQRLKDVLDFDNNILKNYQYNYVNQFQGYSNVERSGYFTKNNCTSGQTGNSVIYTVPAGRYTSTISQADADQKAINDVNTNGQAYANTNGSCSYVGNTTILLRKETFWEGIIGRITFYNSNGTIVEIFPTNSGPEESFQIPSGQYSRIRFDIEPAGASYDGYLNIFSANAHVGCQNIGMNRIELNFYNILFSGSGNSILVYEGCL